MPPADSLLEHLAPDPTTQRHRIAALSITLAVHVAALVVMLQTEVGLVAKTTFLLVWLFLNFFWQGLLRRPACAALISLGLVAGLILLSRFKHDKLWMTVDFVDLLIVDRDTSAFLMKVVPPLRAQIAAAAALMAGILVVTWRFDPLRTRRAKSIAGGLLAICAIVGLSSAFTTDLHEDFLSQNYVSKFARTGVEAVRELHAHGFLETEAEIPGRSPAMTAATCNVSRKLPHIILLHDESSFDLTAAPGVSVPPGYRRYFQSLDGNARKLVVEGAGGPSWFTEYNVLAGLSARSFGRFATSVTRIAAGRVARGLPHSLSRCGYKTFSLYPFYGAFLGSKGFQTSVGIEHYLDMADLGTHDFEPDRFYFDRAVGIIDRERGAGPLFLYVYTVANHFPWDKSFRPELTPDWRAAGNAAEIDEYVRRQGMTAQDYGALLRRLSTEFPAEPFLIVRYGDHQPEFGRRVIDPSLDPEQIARRLRAFDVRYFTTYYAIDAVNFAPADLSSAMERLDAPFLPLVVQEAAGVPLDPSFAEQKRILARCRGVFYRCANGAEARRFNRLLMDAGLITGL